jgi:16S rRNA G966 N2-methylase RsmD
MKEEYEEISKKKVVAESNEFTSSIIKMKPEYSKLVNPLSKLEYKVLKQSISNKGLHLPIIVNQDNIILDGHHRYKICKELYIKPLFEVKRFDNPLDEKEFVIEINVQRRQLNDFQKAELAYELENIEKERARQRQSEAGKLYGKGLTNSIVPIGTNLSQQEKGKAAEIVSKKVDISSRNYYRAKTIIENGPEDIKEKLRHDKTTISKEYEHIQKDRKRSELLAKIKQSDNNNNFENNNYKLFDGDFIKQSQNEIPDNSIDLIFTDPPYGKEYLPLYQELPKLAVRVLKPGGSLVFFAGHIILDEVIRIFHEFSLTKNNSTKLKYWWTLAVKHSGHHQKIYPRYVFAEWKPLLWYIKGERANDLVISNTIGDYIESTVPSKLHHEWEQSPVEAEYITNNLTLENQTVLDPMMGSGTTGIAVLKLNRKFIGIEKDNETFEIAKSRINNQN